MVGEACNQRDEARRWTAGGSVAEQQPACLRPWYTQAHTDTQAGRLQEVCSDPEPPVCYVVCCRTSRVWEKSGRGDEAVGQ